MDNPLFSFCMPLHYSSRKTVERAITSILDQDYENWELVIAINGKRKNLLLPKLAKFKDKRIRTISLERSNVCKARNEAAKLSKGEYLSFFSSDFVLHPGMLKLWVDTFKTHSDADFIYSGYRFIDASTAFTPWPKIDRLLLESENYIDGGMPMKRQVWEENRWDESVKSLNDWDFWLRATNNGINGHYIEDFPYSAEYPKAGGLSFDSHAHWKERIAQIKLKNNIPQRNLCVCSFGASYHGIEMARILGADFKRNPHFKPNDYEMIYLIGFYLNGIEDHTHVISNHEHTSKQCLRVVHHVGGDTFQFGSMIALDTMKYLVRGMQKLGVIHLCETPDARTELHQYGIDAKVIPIPSAITNHKILPMPKKFRVAIYYPLYADPTSKYLEPLMALLIKEMKDTEFILFGCPPYDGKKDGNVLYRGWVDMKDLAKQCSLMVRIVRHDSIPISCTDFVRFGRPVITNIPHMRYMDFFDMRSEGSGPIDSMVGDITMRDARDRLIERITAYKDKKASLPDFEKASLYWGQVLSHEEYKNSIYSLLSC